MDAKLHKRQKQNKSMKKIPFDTQDTMYTKVWYSDSSLKGSYKRRHWCGTGTTNFVRLERCLPGLSLENV